MKEPGGFLHKIMKEPGGSVHKIMKEPRGFFHSHDLTRAYAALLITSGNLAGGRNKRRSSGVVVRPGSLLWELDMPHGGS